MPKLSAAARKKISDSMRKAWAARRAKGQGVSGPGARRPAATKSAATSGNHAGTAIGGAIAAIKTLTLGDIHDLARRKGSAEQLTELARLAIDLKGLLASSAKAR